MNPTPTQPPAIAEGYLVERWISRQDASGIAYAEYWNDKAAEAKKDWNVLDKGFGEMEAMLAVEGFAEDIRRCRQALEDWTGNPLGGQGIDLAAGCLWAVPVLFESPGISHLHCLEYSEHRLLMLGPRVLSHYGISRDRVTLVYGSFYELQLTSQSLDFVLLASAFHHADNPARLLGEIHRVLKPGGKVIVTGEPWVTLTGQYLKYIGKLILPRLIPAAMLRKLFGGRIPSRAVWPPNRENVFPVDPVLGDHLYTLGEYNELFRRAGFQYRAVPGKHMRAFILLRE